MRIRTNPKIIILLRNIQFLKENLRHIRIIMLTSMHNNFLYRITEFIAYCTTYCSGFNKLRTCPNYSNYFNHLLVNIFSFVFLIFKFSNYQIFKLKFYSLNQPIDESDSDANIDLYSDYLQSNCRSYNHHTIAILFSSLKQNLQSLLYNPPWYYQ